MGLASTGLERAGSDSIGLESTGLESTGLERAGSDSTGLESADMENTGLESAGPDRLGLTSLGLISMESGLGLASISRKGGMA